MALQQDTLCVTAVELLSQTVWPPDRLYSLLQLLQGKTAQWYHSNAGLQTFAALTGIDMYIEFDSAHPARRGRAVRDSIPFPRQGVGESPGNRVRGAIVGPPNGRVEF
jgi:hypothetical protein